jgi:hypothetical protein
MRSGEVKTRLYLQFFANEAMHALLRFLPGNAILIGNKILYPYVIIQTTEQKYFFIFNICEKWWRRCTREYFKVEYNGPEKTKDYSSYNS